MTTLGPRFGRKFGWLIVLLAALAATTPKAGAADKVGIVLMHGIGETADAKSPMGKFAAEVQSFGFLVAAPEMPWSKKRGLDKSFDDAMAEIDKAVAELKAKGATKIAVGGHDIGANAALGYGARHEGIAGVLTIKPNLTPEQDSFRKGIDGDLKHAKEMLAAGKGDEKADFHDGLNGKKGVVKTTAKIYLSWYDPQGATVLPTNAKALKHGTSFMWLIGDTDGVGALGRNYVFTQAPDNPNNAFKVISGFHKVMGAKGATETATWLKGL